MLSKLLQTNDDEDSDDDDQYTDKLTHTNISISSGQDSQVNQTQVDSDSNEQNVLNETFNRSSNDSDSDSEQTNFNETIYSNNLVNSTTKDLEELIDPLPLQGYSSAILAIFLAVTAPLSNRIAADYVHKIGSEDGNPVPFLLLTYAVCAAFWVTLYSTYALFYDPNYPLPHISMDMWLKGTFVGMVFFFLPIWIRLQGSANCRRNMRSQKQALASFNFSSVSVWKVTTSIPTAPSLYFMVVLITYTTRLFGFSSYTAAEEFSFFSIAVALLFLTVAREEAVYGKGKSSNQSFLLPGGQSIALPVALTKRWTLLLRKGVRKTRELWLTMNRVLSDIEDNRASWQVLNFLMLQSGMAFAEVIYATATRSSGVFSMSTDNILCSIALAFGLSAIRISTRLPSTMFSYGYFRVESICGFANGVMLIYIAVLIVVESFERSSSQGYGGIARAFSVCLFGILGNLLGLYFFPPETRRENHNVQSIYLHIVTNTLAFLSMAVSTATRALVPDWHSLDIGVACVVGCGIMTFSLPLIIRSGQLLLLMVSKEKQGRLQSVEEQLKSIPGVTRMASLRMWNLTPASVMVSVKLEVENGIDALHRDVLAGARSIFSMIGIAPANCIIQISCADTAALSEKPVEN